MTYIFIYSLLDNNYTYWERIPKENPTTLQNYDGPNLDKRRSGFYATRFYP